MDPGQSKSAPVFVKKEEEFQELVNANSEFLTVVTFVAPWSRNCTNMMDLTREFVADPELQHVVFVELTAEDVPGICSKFTVTSVPNVLFMRKGAVIEKMVGADVRNYASRVLQLANEEPVYGIPVRSVKSQTLAMGVISNDSLVPEVSAPIPLEDRLKQLTTQADVMVFMKGNPEQPRCGFSRQVVQALNETGIPYETFDILEDEDVRQGLKTYSNWQTYPQIYVKGQLIGGLDVLRELQEMGTLVDTLKGQ